MTPEGEVAEQPGPPRISVVIVSLNRVSRLRESLAALGDEHQVIVVDNGSADGSAQLDTEFPHVRFSKLPRNFGLTKALNIGIRAAEGAYVLLLHDDVRIDGADVRRLAVWLEAHPEAAAVCPLLDSPQTASLPSPANPQVAWQGVPAGEGEVVVECAIAAAIMFRSYFLRALRHIDERYGTFGSSIELSQQVRRAGKKLVILRDITAHHEMPESPVRRSLLEGDRAAGMAAFLGKHYGAVPGVMYRLKQGLGALFTFRFKTIAGAFSGVKIDGTS